MIIRRQYRIRVDTCWIPCAYLLPKELVQILLAPGNEAKKTAFLANRQRLILMLPGLNLPGSWTADPTQHFG